MSNAVAVDIVVSEGGAEGVATQTVHAPAPRDRLTSPAPATFAMHTAIPSSRPTSLPEVDVAALASSLSGSLRDTSAMSVAFENAVPVRLRAAANLHAIGFEAAFFLAHVDGCSTIREIAQHAQLPVSRSIDAFRQLFELGVVTLASEAVSPPPPSGVYRTAPRSVA